MKKPSAKRVASLHARKASMNKTAGEVRFIKDNTTGDLSGDWAYGATPSAQRNIGKDFVFDPKQLKPLAKSLRSALMALGHATSCYNTFVKIKSRNISPDGNLGGLGYIMEISNMRKNMMNVIEALSKMTDCMYDEVLAPHWNPAEDELHPRDREQVIDIVEQIKDLHSDPEEYALEEEQEMDNEVQNGVDDEED